MDFLRQTWTLTKKDLLLIARRSWLSTFIRAVAFPIILTVILAEIKTWTSSGSGHGLGTPSRLRTLPEAFDFVGSNKRTFVIVDRGLPGDDVRSVITQLETIARDGGRDVVTVSTVDELYATCPASSLGSTNCFGGVDFLASPSQGQGVLWNYTVYQDGSLGGVNVQSDSNGLQIYTLPLQHAIDSLIANTTVDGPRLPETIMQYPFTYQSQAQVNFFDRETYSGLVVEALAFAFFLALCGISYHLTGHVVKQREEGMLELIDSMMPNPHRWHRLLARMIATHLAFDIVYLPAWIVCGAVVGTLVFPSSNAGWYVLMYILAGLAMTSFSILASSLFRRTQLSAFSAVVAAIAFAIVAQFAEGNNIGTSLPGVLATAILFPPSAFVYFLMAGSLFEILGQPLEPSQLLPELALNFIGPNFWDLSTATFFGCFVFQLIFYPIIACIIERQLWGCSSRGRNLRPAKEMEGNAIRLTKFTKRYNVAAKKRDRTLAVDEISLDLYEGSIAVLLGANGSGKSTTLNCIAGLQSITSGTIEIDGSGGIGLCPQKNVLYDNLTVREHVWFFQRLKNPRLSVAKAHEEVTRLIEGCDLKKKTHARSKTLSGGQMRKLQLAMMLAGGSRVCCIDEASSGIDPLARRRIWDIMTRERGHRTLLMTTHFLDESEVLADHIALLSKGHLRTQGTVASLKAAHGGGYEVIARTKRAPKLLESDLEERYITQHENADGVAYRAHDTETMSWLLHQLDDASVEDYRIKGPTIESVFLNLADEIKPDNSGIDVHLPMELYKGLGCGPFQQTGVLFRKRLTILKHNFMPYVASLFVPLTIAGLVTRFLLSAQQGSGLLCAPPGAQRSLNIDPVVSIVAADFENENLILGPLTVLTGEGLVSRIPNITFDGTYNPQGAQVNAHEVSSLDAFYNAVLSYQPSDNAGIIELAELAGVVSSPPTTIGGFYLDPKQDPVMAWGTDGGSLYGPDNSFILQAGMDMALLNMSLAVSYQTFSSAYSPQNLVQSLLGIFTTIGFVLYPGLFALYPTAERLRRVRAMHYSNGISSGPTWTAYALFDFCFLLVIAILVTVIWATQYEYWFALEYMFVVFLFYGLSSTAYAYVISLFVPSQLAAFALTCLVQVVIAMLYFVGCALTASMAQPSVIPGQLNILFFTIGLISPAVSLMRGCLLVLNVYAVSCDGTNISNNPGGITYYGGPILYLVLQFVALVLFLIYWESGRSLGVFNIFRRRRQIAHEESDIHANGDALERSDRLSSENRGLRVQHVSKTFGDNQAVDDVSFGILPSEKFALLGPNGAGKSTMISLIRGDLISDATLPAGQIHISGDNLERSPIVAKQHLGVCPQFDAVDAMTLSEHLHFYARARGVPSAERRKNVQEIMTRLGLHDHAKKLVKKLSGGTKRKLSLGIALIGNPSVLLLDEPSSGMDAAAKRALWDALRAISPGRSLLITTHSMEEADALCDRAGIMASRMLALGTIDELHKRHGDRVYLQLVHRDAPRTSPENMEQLWSWVRATFVVAETERAVSGHLRFTVPIHRAQDPSAGNDSRLDGSRLASIYRVLEADRFSQDIVDYAVGPATLDQVFLNVVSQHGVDEEDTATPKKPWQLRRRLPWQSDALAAATKNDGTYIEMTSVKGKYDSPRHPSAMMSQGEVALLDHAGPAK